MRETTVLIQGLGLMGGSLAAALTAAGWKVLLAHRRPEVARAAAARGWGTAIPDLTQAVDAGIAVVCTPVETIAGLAREIATATGAVVTDVGSTKAGIVAELADLGAAGRFVGSHPMCGSHLQGLDHADPLLYQGRTVVVTATPATPPAAAARIRRMWQAVGARVVDLDPATHDVAVASASHVPHVLASATAANLAPEAAALCAGGFRDTTRVAGSSAELWTGILLANRAAVGSQLAAVQERLEQLRAALVRDDHAAVTAWLEAGRLGRQRYEAALAPGNAASVAEALSE